MNTCLISLKKNHMLGSLASGGTLSMGKTNPNSKSVARDKRKLLHTLSEECIVFHR